MGCYGTESETDVFEFDVSGEDFVVQGVVFWTAVMEMRGEVWILHL